LASKYYMRHLVTLISDSGEEFLLELQIPQWMRFWQKLEVISQARQVAGLKGRVFEILECDR